MIKLGDMTFALGSCMYTDTIGHEVHTHTHTHTCTCTQTHAVHTHTCTHVCARTQLNVTSSSAN